MACKLTHMAEVVLQQPKKPRLYFPNRRRHTNNAVGNSVHNCLQVKARVDSTIAAFPFGFAADCVFQSYRLTFCKLGGTVGPYPLRDCCRWLIKMAETSSTAGPTRDGCSTTSYRKLTHPHNSLWYFIVDYIVRLWTT